jgi:two-component system, OmpR family, sensor histidine kinase NblS
MRSIFKNITENNDSDYNLLGLSTQNKLIILGSLLSSFLIVITAWFIINNTQKTILDSYKNFGLMLANTLAVEGSDLLSGKITQEKYNQIRTHANLVVKNNNDIAYIVFKDNRSSTVYSTKNESFNQRSFSKIVEVSQPITAEINGTEQVVGSIFLGLTGNTKDMVGKATRNLMLGIFSAAWLISICAVLFNTHLITRQIKLLVEGVNRVSSGEFGYKITSKDLWGEIKQLFEAFNDMSGRLRHYEEKNVDQLTYERNKLEAILMSIANGVIVCDNFDKVVLVNNSAIRMLGISVKDILNTRIIDYYDANGKPCFQEDIGKFKDTPLEEIEARPFVFETAIENKVLKSIISPIFDTRHDYLGYILIMHDITQEAEINRMKNTFISNVSHELRTPVTVLRSYIDTLFNYSHEFDDKTKHEFLSIMNQEADRLNKTVNDILDFSRLESPNVELEKTLCDMGPIIEITAKSMRVLAEERDLSFSIIIEPDLPKIMINPESIERVLKNLLSNAIKYSHENGRIKIRAEVDRTGNYLQVTVEDNGIGIPEIHLSRIFDRFYRVETKTHTIKGTGLGLHLAKITIEKHHSGNVFVESKIDEGSTFGFRIPLQNKAAEV